MVLIRTTGERQAMDWSLALASQEIASVILPPQPDQPSWALAVDTKDAARALRTLRLYHLENRRRPTLLMPAVGELLFHWGVLVWCLLQVVVFWASEAPGNLLTTAGEFSTAATAQGEWWRPLTATFLHAGPEHLAANLTTGFLLLSLAMGRFGVGGALLGTLAAGTLGNLLAWWWRGTDYVGLGASGAVLGALGMLAVSLAADARAGRVSRGTLTRGLLGGSLLFILLGTSPNSDVLAHVGGFIAGAAIAVVPAFLTRPSTVPRPRRDLGLALAYLVASAGCWVAALS